MIACFAGRNAESQQPVNFRTVPIVRVRGELFGHVGANQAKPNIAQADSAVMITIMLVEITAEDGDAIRSEPGPDLTSCKRRLLDSGGVC